MNAKKASVLSVGNILKLKKMEADHIMPWSKGGKTIAENCQILCKDCNQRKFGV